MKKKLVTVLLASSMVATMLAGCGSGSGDGTEKGSSAKGGDGSVYMLNFKPETDQAWQDLAEKYKDETGVQVTVVTAADGQYKTTLKSELAKKEAPTIFNIGSTADCAEYDKYIYDLKDSEIYKHLTDKSLALEYNGKIASVANCYECYGIIYNKAILEKYCSNYSGAVIKSVDDIKDGDWEYANFADDNENGYTVKQSDLSMMPIYFGVDDENEGLAVGTENHWTVNAKADQKDIDATLEFLNWVITSDDGRDAIVNKMGLSAPFDTFTGDYESKNAFANVASELAKNGKTSVAWSFNATPSVDDWRADFLAPLTEYTERNGSWDDVTKAFSEKWAYYWDLQNEQ